VVVLVAELLGIAAGVVAVQVDYSLVVVVQAEKVALQVDYSLVVTGIAVRREIE
jgi:hypothetical protein